jgi:transcriptional regulator with XRE-family HTH domain
MTRQANDTERIEVFSGKVRIRGMSAKFAEWFKKERQARELSIREIAPKMGYSHSHIAKIERNEAAVTFEFCEKAAKFFNIPVWDIFGVADLLNNVPASVYKNEKSKVLLESFNKLPDQGKEELLKYAAWLVHQHSK